MTHLDFDYTVLVNNNDSAKHDKSVMITASIQLPDELFDRLQRLTLRTGLSLDFYLIEALSAQIRSLENRYAAKELVPEMPGRHTLTYTLDDMERELGLAT